MGINTLTESSFLHADPHLMLRLVRPGFPQIPWRTQSVARSASAKGENKVNHGFNRSWLTHNIEIAINPLTGRIERSPT
jgi:hypothetical protein